MQANHNEQQQQLLALARQLRRPVDQQLWDYSPILRLILPRAADKLDPRQLERPQERVISGHMIARVRVVRVAHRFYATNGTRPGSLSSFGGCVLLLRIEQCYRTSNMRQPEARLDIGVHNIYVYAEMVPEESPWLHLPFMSSMMYYDVVLSTKPLDKDRDALVDSNADADDAATTVHSTSPWKSPHTRSSVDVHTSDGVNSARGSSSSSSTATAHSADYHPIFAIEAWVGACVVPDDQWYTTEVIGLALRTLCMQNYARRSEDLGNALDVDHKCIELASLLHQHLIMSAEKDARYWRRWMVDVLCRYEVWQSIYGDARYANVRIIVKLVRCGHIDGLRAALLEACGGLEVREGTFAGPWGEHVLCAHQLRGLEPCGWFFGQALSGVGCAHYNSQRYLPRGCNPNVASMHWMGVWGNVHCVVTLALLFQFVPSILFSVHLCELMGVWLDQLRRTVVPMGARDNDDIVAAAAVAEDDTSGGIDNANAMLQCQLLMLPILWSVVRSPLTFPTLTTVHSYMYELSIATHRTFLDLREYQPVDLPSTVVDVPPPLVEIVRGVRRSVERFLYYIRDGYCALYRDRFMRQLAFADHSLYVVLNTEAMMQHAAMQLDVRQIPACNLFSVHQMSRPLLQLKDVPEQRFYMPYMGSNINIAATTATATATATAAATATATGIQRTFKRNGRRRSGGAGNGSDATDKVAPDTCIWCMDLPTTILAMRVTHALSTITEAVSVYDVAVYGASFWRMVHGTLFSLQREHDGRPPGRTLIVAPNMLLAHFASSALHPQQVLSIAEAAHALYDIRCGAHAAQPPLLLLQQQDNVTVVLLWMHLMTLADLFSLFTAACRANGQAESSAASAVAAADTTTASDVYHETGHHKRTWSEMEQKAASPLLMQEYCIRALVCIGTSAMHLCSGRLHTAVFDQLVRMYSSALVTGQDALDVPLSLVNRGAAGDNGCSAGSAECVSGTCTHGNQNALVVLQKQLYNMMRQSVYQRDSAASVRLLLSTSLLSSGACHPARQHVHHTCSSVTVGHYATPRRLRRRGGDIIGEDEEDAPICGALFLSKHPSSVALNWGQLSLKVPVVPGNSDPMRNDVLLHVWLRCMSQMLVLYVLDYKERTYAFAEHATQCISDLASVSRPEEVSGAPLTAIPVCWCGTVYDGCLSCGVFCLRVRGTLSNYVLRNALLVQMPTDSLQCRGALRVLSDSHMLGYVAWMRNVDAVVMPDQVGLHGTRQVFQQMSPELLPRMDQYSGAPLDHIVLLVLPQTSVQQVLYAAHMSVSGVTLVHVNGAYSCTVNELVDSIRYCAPVSIAAEGLWMNKMVSNWTRLQEERLISRGDPCKRVLMINPHDSVCARVGALLPL